MTDLNKTITVIFNVFKDDQDLCVSPIADPDIEYSANVGANDNPGEYESIAKQLIRSGNGFLNKTNQTAEPTRYLFERIDGSSPQIFQVKATISF